MSSISRHFLLTVWILRGPLSLNTAEARTAQPRLLGGYPFEDDSQVGERDEYWGQNRRHRPVRPGIAASLRLGRDALARTLQTTDEVAALLTSRQ